jgi:octaprenyl-diphosphate synthase
MHLAQRTRSPRLEKAFELVLPKLGQVETALALHIESPAQTISGIGDWVLAAGGKRIRPALLLMVSKLLGYEGEQDVLFGTVVEYIHTATLVQDDVIDESTVRRGRPSANAKWGNSATVLFGDYLYSKALKLALDNSSDLRAFRLLNDSILRMIEGEILALESEGSIDLTRDQYFEILRRKTAALFSATCELPCFLAPGGTRWSDRLREYGLRVGIAFQLIDDLLDYTASEKALGKPVLSDLREGKLTLPLILAMPDLAPAERSAVATVLQERDFTSVEPETILEIVRRHGTLERTRALAEESSARARDAILPLPEGDAKEALLFAPEFILTRDV